MRRGLLLSFLCRIKEVQMFSTQNLKLSNAQESITPRWRKYAGLA